LTRRRRDEHDLKERAQRLWVEDNIRLVEEGHYTSPEDCELEEGGYFERAELPVDMRGQWLSAVQPHAEALGFKVVLAKEHRNLVKAARENAEKDEKITKLEAENAKIKAELKELRELVSRLPRQRFRVVKPLGILREGQMIETHDLNWAEENVKRGFLAGDESVAEAKLYCNTVGQTVTVTIAGRVEGKLAEGNVEKCSFGACKGAGFCWLGRHVLTSYEET
jgi:hypothetical protein